jgi:hypothetical protein
MSQPRPTSSLEALVNADLDTLATALYVKPTTCRRDHRSSRRGSLR